MTIIFVYGTLKRGNWLHSHLRSAEFIGEAQTVSDGFRMFCNGAYPYVVSAENGYRILGELFRVDSETIESLDSIERGYTRIVTLFICNGETIQGELYVAPCGDDLLRMRETTLGEWFSPISTLGGDWEKYFSEMSE